MAKLFLKLAFQRNLFDLEAFACTESIFKNSPLEEFVDKVNKSADQTLKFISSHQKN